MDLPKIYTTIEYWIRCWVQIQVGGHILHKFDIVPYHVHRMYLVSNLE